MNVEARARRYRCPSCGADYRGAAGRCPFDAAVLEEIAETLIGSKLGGFDVLEVLGSGAGATVYAARRTGTTGQPSLALKVLRADLAENDAHRARFLREARAAMRVTHPGVVAMHETSADHAVPVYLVMDRLHGASIAQHLEQVGVLGVSEVRFVAGRIAAALLAAHDAGVVHRDVKPANVILENGVLHDRAGRVVVVDFGLACAAGEVGVTSTGELVGTPHFMAPEQILGQAPGPAVDAYALGCMIVTMLRGAPPFSGTTGAVLDAHLERRAPELASGDAELDAWAAALLEKKPAPRITAFSALAAQGNAS